MRYAKDRLERIIREELTNHIKALLQEAPGTGARRLGREVTDARKDSEEKDKAAGKPPKKGPEKPGAKKAGPKAPPVDDPALERPPDKPSPEAQAANGDDRDGDQVPDSGEETAADVSGGQISKELVGKSVQSITTEPKSKLMPGAQEIVVTFNEIPDPLRILIGKTGMIKFYFKGLHNQV